MRKALGAVTLLVAAVIQSTWAFHLEIGGAFPNLVLLAVVAITWTEGVRPGLAAACVGGLLLDLTAPGAIGPHALALLACAYMTGFWPRNLEGHGFVYVALSAGLATVPYSLILLLAGALSHVPVTALGDAAGLVLAAAVYNGALAPVAFAIANRLRPQPGMVVTA
jgi:rod shape-determining protein MreD